MLGCDPQQQSREEKCKSKADHRNATAMLRKARQSGGIEKNREIGVCNDQRSDGNARNSKAIAQMSTGPLWHSMVRIAAAR